ncbi:MAG: hypothetical protein ACK55Z_22375, partial [bacterium]
MISNTNLLGKISFNSDKTVENISKFYLGIPLFYSVGQVLVYFLVAKPSVNKLIAWYMYYYVTLNLWPAFSLSFIYLLDKFI